jgi:hypothetical protein
MWQKKSFPTNMASYVGSKAFDSFSCTDLVREEPVKCWVLGLLLLLTLRFKNFVWIDYWW